MDMVKDILREELKTAKEKLDFYQAGLRELPRGSLRIKVIKGREYFYLKYRDGLKTKTDYIGKLPDNADAIENLKLNIEKRKRFEKNIKTVSEEIKYLERALNVRTK